MGIGQQSLQVGLNSSVAPGDKKMSSDSSSKLGDSDVKPFSSTLNEQLEQPVKKKPKDELGSQDDLKAKKSEKSEAKPKSEVDKEEQIAEQKVDESGNIIPVEEATVNVDLIIGQEPDSVEPEDSESVELPTIETNVNSLAASIDGSKSEKNKQQAEAPIPGATNTNKLVEVPILKGQEVLDDTQETESKPVLRSDILNAINDKLDKKADTVKDIGVVTKESIFMGQKKVDVPVNDAQKMAQLLATSKADGTLLADGQRSSAPTFGSMLSATTSATAITGQTGQVAQPSFSMQPSMQSEAWGKVLSSRVVWMAREGVQQAELKLNPSNLGPVEVKLHMKNDQAHVTFVAHHAATRDALEQALPRLRESFQENGMNLADAGVSDQAPEQQAEDEGTDNTSRNGHDVALQQEGGEHGQVSEKNEELSGSSEVELGVSVFA